MTAQLKTSFPASLASKYGLGTKLWSVRYEQMAWKQLLGHALKGKRSSFYFRFTLPASKNVDVMAIGRAATFYLEMKALSYD